MLNKITIKSSVIVGLSISLFLRNNCMYQLHNKSVHKITNLFNTFLSSCLNFIFEYFVVDDTNLV